MSDDLAAALRQSAGAQERRFRRVLDANGGCQNLELRWSGRGGEFSLEVPVPPPLPEWIGFEFDEEGFAAQMLRVGDRILRLYPILDPFSFEHAVNVEQVILPAILDRFRRDPTADVFAPFRAFYDSLGRARDGDVDAVEGFSPEDLRVFEIVKADVSEKTDDESLRCRAFVRYYQHRVCDNDDYRRKAEQSLNDLVHTVNALQSRQLESLSAALREGGFVEETARTVGD